MSTLAALFNEVSNNNSVQVPIDDRQVLNHTGGYVFKITPEQWFLRFLILGTEGGTYYQKEKHITAEAKFRIKELLLTGNASWMLDMIKDVSVNGRAPRNAPAVVALAMLTAHANEDMRRAALEAMPSVARYSTDMFAFVEVLKNESGLGSMKTRLIARWYTSKTAEKLAVQFVKYRQRNGWTHRDVLRLSHPKSSDAETRHLFQWVCLRETQEKIIGYTGSLPLVKAFIKISNGNIDVDEVIATITEHKLPREAIPTHFLNDAGVWYALLEDMLPEAMIRNLGKMGSLGILNPGDIGEAAVLQTLQDIELLKQFRIHPMKVLLALSVYREGRGVEGELTWTPNPRIVNALEKAFYDLFSIPPKTKARFVVAVDVSGSMAWDSSVIKGSHLTARECAAALSLLFMRQSPSAVTVAFSYDLEILPYTMETSLSEAMEIAANMNMGNTNIAAPFEWALENKVEADVFVVITDNEVNSGNHPSLMLRKYRNETGIDAKLVVMGLSATNFSIADPDDKGMLDVVGFDANVPAIIDQFIGS